MNELLEKHHFCFLDILKEVCQDFEGGCKIN